METQSRVVLVAAGGAFGPKSQASRNARAWATAPYRWVYRFTAGTARHIAPPSREQYERTEYQLKLPDAGPAVGSNSRGSTGRDLGLVVPSAYND
jgi:hypothetical protein